MESSQNSSPPQITQNLQQYQCPLVKTVRKAKLTNAKFITAFGNIYWFGNQLTQHVEENIFFLFLLHLLKYQVHKIDEG
jgi:hypothetical protein